MPVFFDTLQYVNTLLEAGMPKSQAEALAKEQVKLLQQQMEQLATKSDLHLLKVDLNVRLDSLENKIVANEKQVDVRFESLESKIATNEKRAEERFKTGEERLKAEIAQLQSHLILVLGSGLGVAVSIILGALQFMR